MHRVEYECMKELVYFAFDILRKDFFIQRFILIISVPMLSFQIFIAK